MNDINIISPDKAGKDLLTLGKDLKHSTSRKVNNQHMAF